MSSLAKLKSINDYLSKVGGDKSVSVQVSPSSLGTLL